MSVFFDDQIKAMYPNNNPATKIINNEKFDITFKTRILSKLILKPLTGWSSEPRYNETSFGANVMRIKIIMTCNA